MSTTDVLPYQSDFYVELDALIDVTDGSYVNDATVTITLRTKAGAAVSGATDLPATNVNAFGKYRVPVPHTVSFLLDRRYDCEAKAVKGGREMHFWQEVVVRRWPA